MGFDMGLMELLPSFLCARLSAAACSHPLLHYRQSGIIYGVISEVYTVLQRANAHRRHASTLYLIHPPAESHLHYFSATCLVKHDRRIVEIDAP